MTTELHPDAEAVADIALMAGLPADVLRQVAGVAYLRHIPSNSWIFCQGEPAARAHALLSGCVRITQTDSDGAEIVIRFIGAGEIFGCAPLLTDGLYPADAMTMVDCVEISWAPADLLALMRREPDIAINMTAILGKRIGETQERLRELATQGVERRIARTLLRLLDQAGERTEAGIRITFPLRRKDIADIAGTTLHTVSRILTQWERRDMLTSRKQSLVVMSPDDIRRIAEGGG